MIYRMESTGREIAMLYRVAWGATLAWGFDAFAFLFAWMGAGPGRYPNLLWYTWDILFLSGAACVIAGQHKWQFRMATALALCGAAVYAMQHYGSLLWSVSHHDPTQSVALGTFWASYTAMPAIWCLLLATLSYFAGRRVLRLDKASALPSRLWRIPRAGRPE